MRAVGGSNATTVEVNYAASTNLYGNVVMNEILNLDGCGAVWRDGRKHSRAGDRQLERLVCKREREYMSRDLHQLTKG